MQDDQYAEGAVVAAEFDVDGPIEDEEQDPLREFLGDGTKEPLVLPILAELPSTELCMQLAAALTSVLPRRVTSPEAWHARSGHRATKQVSWQAGSPSD